jgi:hypothetical protein
VDFAELLVLLFFFLVLPILEQVKRRQSGGKRPGGPQEPGRGRGGPPAREEGPDRAREPAADPASEMVPDDLWAILTGERRAPAPTRPEPAEADEPEWAGAGPVAEEDESAWVSSPPVEVGSDRDPSTRAPARWDLDDEIEPTPPVSLEYRGPEAYSLESLDQEAVSLERPIPSPGARHRAFHARYDRPAVSRPRPRSAIGRALGNRPSVRQAIVLSEVLGPPKGLG